MTLGLGVATGYQYFLHLPGWPWEANVQGSALSPHCHVKSAPKNFKCGEYEYQRHGYCTPRKCSPIHMVMGGNLTEINIICVFTCVYIILAYSNNKFQWQENQRLCSIHQWKNHPASMCPAEQARWRPVSPREEVSSDPRCVEASLHLHPVGPSASWGPGAHAHRSLLASRRYWTWKGWKDMERSSAKFSGS